MHEYYKLLMPAISPAPATTRVTHADVLGFGCVAVDDLCFVESYPRADAKARVLRTERRFGGLIGTALVAAARLGSRCVFEGTLGRDELSLFALEAMRREGIDLSRVARHEHAGPVHSCIVVGNDRGTRNIFFDRSRLFPPIRRGLRGAVTHARVLLVDHHDAEQKIAAARIARERGIPIVADFEGTEEPRFAELLAAVDHLILSHDFAARLCATSSPAAILPKLWNGSRQAAVVTCGDKGVWFVTASDPGRPRRLPAFAVKAIDTTGCGDVFHGAYAAALARRLPVEECLRFASAAAALKASRPAGPGAIPQRREVERFLRRASL